MHLPNGSRAVVDIAKLREYCLNSEHPEGRHKARVFRSTFCMTAGEAEELREMLLAAAHDEDTVESGADAYGRRYIVDFMIRRGGQMAVVRSAWITKIDEVFPRLASCYVL